MLEHLIFTTLKTAHDRQRVAIVSTGPPFNPLPCPPSLHRPRNMGCVHPLVMKSSRRQATIGSFLIEEYDTFKNLIPVSIIGYIHAQA